MTRRWMPYQEQVQTPEWYTLRRQVYNRDDFACVDCGEDGVRIHCHHEYYVKGKLAWEYPLHAFVTLCDGCHEKRHKHFSKMSHATQEDAEMWLLFTLADAMMLEEHLKDRDNRIRWLEDRDAIWEGNGRYWCFVDKKGRSRCFDEDGKPM
jgi:hypothetical protein